MSDLQLGLAESSTDNLRRWRAQLTSSPATLYYARLLVLIQEELQLRAHIEVLLTANNRLGQIALALQLSVAELQQRLDVMGLGHPASTATLQDRGFCFVLREGRCTCVPPAEIVSSDVDCTGLSDEDFELLLRTDKQRPASLGRPFEPRPELQRDAAFTAQLARVL